MRSTRPLGLLLLIAATLAPSVSAGGCEPGNPLCREPIAVVQGYANHAFIPFAGEFADRTFEFVAFFGALQCESDLGGSVDFWGSQSLHSDINCTTGEPHVPIPILP